MRQDETDQTRKTKRQRLQTTVVVQESGILQNSVVEPSNVKASMPQAQHFLQCQDGLKRSMQNPIEQSNGVHDSTG
ncbi:hypothetical protein WJX74_003522 [Apatococcus lobatus]|uniref:Uncharacterized protein n=1 Tax=Apatococcus lobatus TaxID=904363 RepID=A0AAW1RL86_9CHLO